MALSRGKTFALLKKTPPLQARDFPKLLPLVIPDQNGYPLSFFLAN